MTNSDFASAAMVRVLREGLRALGLDVDMDAAPAMGRGRVPLDAKRAIVEGAVRARGLGMLTLLGRGLHGLAHDPTHRSLAAARDAGDLFARWRRLERYIHSRHRVDVVLLTHEQARLRHRSLDSRAPPLAAEDLVVLGVLAALLETIGSQAVRAWVDGVPAYPRPDATGLLERANQGKTAEWTLAWECVADAPPRSSVAPTAVAGIGPPADVFASSLWPPTARRVAATMAGDLAQARTVADLARAIGMAPRSLQRSLASAGLTCSSLLMELRMRAAAWWLLNTPVAIAEIGFVCGFADQPHFTRCFGDRVGLTPAKYRDAFSTGSSDSPTSR